MSNGETMGIDETSLLVAACGARAHVTTTESMPS